MIFTFCYRTTEGVFSDRLEAEDWETAADAAEELGGYALGPIISVIPAGDSQEHESWKGEPPSEEHYPDPPPCPEHLRDRLVFASTWDERVALARAHKAEAELAALKELRNAELERTVKVLGHLQPAQNSEEWGKHLCEIAASRLATMTERAERAEARNVVSPPKQRMAVAQWKELAQREKGRAAAWCDAVVKLANDIGLWSKGDPVTEADPKVWRQIVHAAKDQRAAYEKLGAARADAAVLAAALRDACDAMDYRARANAGLDAVVDRGRAALAAHDAARKETR